MHSRYSVSIKTKPQSSHEFVSKGYESLDYDRYSNDIVVREEEERGKKFLASIVLQRILLFFIVGAISGIISCTMDILVYIGANIKYYHLGKTLEENFDSNFSKVCVIWMISVVLPAIFGCVLVLYGELKASGGGMTWCMAYLNGVDLDQYMTFKVLIVKICSCMLCVVAGLPGGKEAPLVHTGAIAGSMVPLLQIGKWRPFDYFRQDPERRDLTAGGSGAGLASAFSTPLAAIVMTFEESISFWTAELTFLIFISAVCSYIVALLMSEAIIENNLENAGETHVLLEILQKEGPFEFYPFEVFTYALVGAIGGLLGAVWNYIQVGIIIFRKKYVSSQPRRFIDLIVCASVLGGAQLLLFWCFSSRCIAKSKSGTFHHGEHGAYDFKLGCPEGEVPTVRLLFVQTSVRVLQSFFTVDNEPIGLAPLFWFFMYNFFGSCFLCGSFIAHGVFVPHIVTGTAWGRLFGEALLYLKPDWNWWVQPNKFAFLGGASQLCGSLQIPFTISVMMLEICNTNALALPIFIVVCFSRFVSAILNESLYHTQCHFAGLPLLDREAPSNLSKMKVRQLAAKQTNLTTLPVKTTYRQIYEAIQTNHNGFPVVESQSVSFDANKFVRTYGKLTGLIQRQHLITIINNRLRGASDLEDQAMVKKVRREYSEKMDINMEVVRTKGDTQVDLHPFMNQAPYVVHEDDNVPSAYRLFSNLGLRHLIVIDDDFKVAGIITRKDLSVFRHHFLFFKAKTVILPVK